MSALGPITARPVNPDDRKRFPNIAAARAHLTSLSPEQRAKLQAKWEQV